MRKFLFLVFLLPVLSVFSQNWDVNTLEKINSWDSKFVKGYSKTISNTTLYIAAGLPLGMAVYGEISKDKTLLKDAVYIGTTVLGAVAISYSMKFMVDRERPYDRYPGLIDARAHESSPSFPSSHTAAAFSLATSLSIK